jgi:hypothetical protein
MLPSLFEIGIYFIYIIKTAQRNDPCILFKKLRRIIMAFKALFLAHAPDADKAKHRILIDTGVYQLFSII